MLRPALVVLAGLFLLTAGCLEATEPESQGADDTVSSARVQGIGCESAGLGWLADHAAVSEAIGPRWRTGEVLPGLAGVGQFVLRCPDLVLDGQSLGEQWWGVAAVSVEPVGEPPLGEGSYNVVLDQVMSEGAHADWQRLHGFPATQGSAAWERLASGDPESFRISVATDTGTLEAVTTVDGPAEDAGERRLIIVAPGDDGDRFIAGMDSNLVRTGTTAAVTAATGDTLYSQLGGLPATPAAWFVANSTFDLSPVSPAGPAAS